MNNTIVGSVNENLKKYSDSIVTLIRENQQVIDLESFLKESPSVKYSDDYQYAFTKTSTTQFSEKIAREVGRLNHDYKMGFLPSINHMWLSSGSTLFLWNFVEGTGVFIYNSTETIENVEVIKFLTHFELVVCTASKIYLHGISQPHQEKIKLISTASVPSDCVIMSNFTTTNTRRVFMQGSDGHVYELIVITNADGLTTSCRLNCHTASALVRYLPSFFKSVPEVPVKHMVVDDKEKMLYLLLADSSIHSVNIQGSVYQPVQRHNSTESLASIHLIFSTESKHINLMAITNTGDRLYFACKDKSIDVIDTIPAPPLPGSLLFNRLTKETCDLSLYNHGVFAALLAKSDRKYLVFTAANLVRDSQHKFIYTEDVYHKTAENKIWSIMETSHSVSLNNHYLKETLESPESPSRQFATLSKSGITYYTKQRPVDHLLQVLTANNNKALSEFISRYGPVEACAVAFMLASSTKQTPQVSELIQSVSCKDDGLLLHFSRVVESIWDIDILAAEFQDDEFKAVQNRLHTLLRLIYRGELNVDKCLVTLIQRSIEGISLLSFINHQDWQEIKKGVSDVSTACSLSNFVSTEQGALLAKELVLITIKTTATLNSANNYSYISSYILEHCSVFLGEANVTYYKGLECLQAAHNKSNDAEKALQLSLNHFQTIIDLFDLGHLQPICHEYCKLNNHIGAIQLAYYKHQALNSPDDKLFDIIYAAVEDSLTKGDAYAKNVIETGLRLTEEQKFHYNIYQWLMTNQHKGLLVTLDSTQLKQFIETQLSPSESLACRRNYHVYRDEYALAIRCLLELATHVSDIPLDHRINFLGIASEYLENIKAGQDDLSPQERASLALQYNESKIQLELYTKLIESDEKDAKHAAAELKVNVKLAHDLRTRFAYTHSLHKEALQLLKLENCFDWAYVKLAWEYLLGVCDKEEDVERMVKEMADILYPSMTSFPVFTIYEILKSQYNDTFAQTVLTHAGIEADVIQDASAK